MTTPYENTRLKRMIENNKKLEALNLPTLSQSLNKSHESYSKPSPSVKGRPKFVQPGELEVNKKRLRSTTTRKSSITPPPIKTTITSLSIQTTITHPPIKTTITPPPVQTTKDVVVDYEDEDVVEGDETKDDVAGVKFEDVVVGDEAEDVVVGDEAEDVVVDETKDVVKVAKYVYWDVKVIKEEGNVSNTYLCVKDLVAKSEPDGTWIILDFDKDHCAIGQASDLLVADTKTNFYESKIKRHFLVDDGRDKKFIFAFASKKSRDARSQLRKEKTQKLAQKNVENRAKLNAPHTLGSKSFARKKHDLESRDGRTYSRGEMYAISHKKFDGSFVNEDAYNNNCYVSKNEAFQKVFGKEQHGYVRSVGLGATSSQINRSTRLASSSAENEKIKEMQEEINALKEKNSKIDELMETVTFLTQRDNARTKEIELLLQMQNSSGRRGLESPADGRRSSESSYRI
ncbi:unnamed protein product [Vicia faba]|uniref:Uncharacterized protein n=1 Tax=Vicia faba TaxID=3906 RepID=A0AAV0YGB6_VICFA|nr:unnamed protein product [Vicia faba]